MLVGEAIMECNSSDLLAGELNSDYSTASSPQTQTTFFIKTNAMKKEYSLVYNKDPFTHGPN
jgi:hypothetical protein